MNRKAAANSKDTEGFRGEPEVTSAREIADAYGFPFEITAKTLQRMKDSGLIQSAQGSRGGYLLQGTLKKMTFGEFLYLMEGPQSIVACTADCNDSSGAFIANSQVISKAPTKIREDCCEYQAKCEIHPIMSFLNTRLQQFLSNISLIELLNHTEDSWAAFGKEGRAISREKGAI